ncbi:MAG: phenylalanine--tRNA ligase subunit beta, partial [Chthoniobacterales bacterium]
TPKRADLLSHFGLAREIAALTEKPLRAPDITEGKPIQDKKVRIAAPRECPFYSARRIETVMVRPSPDWLRTRLEATGLRPINNIVDITNYVMLELGQPLHAFDADKLQGGINVRLAAEGEKFLALDGNEYELSSRDLLIADEKRAVGIGGVMGGEETRVTETTRNVLLEAAYFLPSSVRRTARSLNLPSDASYRFERGVDPATTLKASARAAELIRELAGGTPAQEVAVAGAPPSPPDDVTLRYARSEELLGITIQPREIDRILESFGLQKTGERAAISSSWKIPSHRIDLRRDVDLIEEIIRAHGIDKVPSTYRSRFTPQSEADRSRDFENAIRQKLIALGISEARTSSLIPRAAITAAESAVELKNPLSEDHVGLRPSLIRGLLDVLERNLNTGAFSVRLFELGNIFVPSDAKERRALAFLLCGLPAGESLWRAGDKRQLDFLDLKGTIEVLRIPKLNFRRSSRDGFAVAAEITSDGEVIGFAGQLSATRAADLGAISPVLVAQIDLDAVPQRTFATRRFVEINRYPGVTRDISMVVDEAVTHEQIMKTIHGEDLLETVQVFDLLVGEDAEKRFGPGRKSVAYTLTYRDTNRTLTNDEVTVVHTRIRDRLKSELGAELRE